MQGSRAFAFLCALAVSGNVFAAPGQEDFSRANLSLLSGRFEEALALYDQIRGDRSHPHAEDSAYLAARCCLRMNAAEQAQARLQAFLKSYPQSPWCDDALMDLADLDAADSVSQDLRSAIARYEYLLANHSSGDRVVEALQELGNAYVKVENWDKAEKTFYQFLSHARTDEQEVKARLLIAALFSADSNPNQDLPRALSEYEQWILAKFPKSRQLPTAYFGHAEVKRKLRDPEHAIASYRTVVERWPQHSLAPLAQSLIAYCQEQQAQLAASPQDLETFKGASRAERAAASPGPGSAVDLKEQIQILSDTSSKNGEAVTEFSGGVNVFYAGAQIFSELASYDSEQRLMTIGGPAQVQLRDKKFSSQGPIKLDPELQVIEMRQDAQVDPRENLPRCSDERLHLHLATGKLSCVP